MTTVNQLQGAKRQQVETQNMRNQGTTERDRWERDSEWTIEKVQGQPAQLSAQATTCADRPEPANEAERVAQVVDSLRRGAKQGAVRSRLPAGPTEAELLCGYAVNNLAAVGGAS